MSASSVVNRRNKILQQLSSQGSVRIADLIAMLNVSDETIRKDLQAMEERGILRREHGGATLTSFNEEEDEISRRNTENLEVKNRIAREALKYIPAGEPLVIALDAGSTSYCLAQFLAQRSGQTIITSSIPVAELFNGDKNDVYLLGGKLRQKDRSLYGQWALNFIGSIRISVAILGSSGVKNRNGLCAVTFDDADIKHAYIKNSERSIALLDSSKFHKCSMVESAKWEELDMVITDDGIQEEDRAVLSKETNLIVV
jgi:DeoR/GlpR family transcriptional regulator of sugar metabolism